MTKKLMLIWPLLLLISSVSHAELSRTITFATDYVYRGISNSSGAPAIQGAFDYAHDSGAYAGLWASNVKFRENAAEAAVDAVDEATIEVDYYIGYYGEASEVMSWDLGLTYITYPGAESSLKYEYLEAYGILNYSITDLPMEPELGFELYHTNNNFEDSGAASYINAGLSLSLPFDASLSINAGRSTFDDFPGDDYTDYRIGLSTEIKGYELALDYTDTSISKLNCGDDTCESRVVLSVTSSM